MKKLFLVALMMATTNIVVTAQTTNSRIAPANEVKPYKVKVLEKLGGMRHDEVTTIIGDSIYFDAETIEGFYFGANAGVNGDFGRHREVFGPTGALTVGYAGKRADLGARAGVSYLCDINGKGYYAPNLFVVGAVNLFTWGKDPMGRKNEKYRLQLLLQAGVQEAKVKSGTSYEDEYVKIEENDKERAMGMALGVGLRLQKREEMGPSRLGVEFFLTAYDTKNSFKTIWNEIQIINESSNPWRFCAGVTVSYNFVVHKHADNYRQKTKKWLSKY